MGYSVSRAFRVGRMARRRQLPTRAPGLPHTPAFSSSRHAMPILKWFPPQGPPRAFVLHKPVTTVGRALGNDVAIAGDGLAETHAQVLFDGRDFNLEEVDKQADILINGKKKRRARLVHGDRLTLGDVELAFSMFDEPARHAGFGGRGAGRPGVARARRSSRSPTSSSPAFRKLYEFSEKLMTMTEHRRAPRGDARRGHRGHRRREGPHPPQRRRVHDGPEAGHAAPESAATTARRAHPRGAQREPRGHHRRRRAPSATASCARCSRRAAPSS